MGDLIQALTIFQKYEDRTNPTICEHDVLYIVGVTREKMSAEDAEALEKLGFLWGEDGWFSYRFGSA